MSAMSLQNRLRIAANVWRETTSDPLPRIPSGQPHEQVERFEVEVVELLAREATPERARALADLSWSMVEDRPEPDPVRRRVVRLHEQLAELAHGRPDVD